MKIDCGLTISEEAKSATMIWDTGYHIDCSLFKVLDFIEFKEYELIEGEKLK